MQVANVLYKQILNLTSEVFVGYNRYMNEDLYKPKKLTRSRAKDLTNQTFGKLTVKYRLNSKRSGEVLWECSCACGNSTRVSTNHLTRKNLPVKSCGCLKKRNGKQHQQWEGFEEISGNFWHNHVIRSANGSKGRKKLSLNITKEYIWDLFLEQDRKCALSGLEINFPKKWDDKGYTASIDRINSAEGYIKGNVQLLHKDINMMKRTYSQEYFVKMCKLISKYKS